MTAIFLATTIKVPGEDLQLSEAEGFALAADGRSLYGRVAFQSQLTTLMADAIFAGSPCGLPTLAESAQQHTSILNALLDHWNLYTPNKDERLPIT